MERTEKQIRFIRNNWSKGVDYCVIKQGKKWMVFDFFGNFPLFKTKKEAYQAVTNLVMSF